MKKIATLAIFAFAISLLSAQRPAEQIALRYLQQEADRWSLLPTDLADLVVTDQYTSPLNGVTHVYLAQRWHGIPVFLAQAGIHLQEDQVRYATCPFIPQLAERINAETPVLTPYEAVLQAAAATGLHITRPLTLLESTPKHALFSKGDLTQADIPVDIVYYQAPGQYELRLAWNLALAPLGSSDLWSIRVDALTGTVLDQQNWTRYCRFPAEPFAPSHDHSCSPTEPHPTSPAPLAAFNGTGTYHVFPLPVESPIHGNRQVVTDPADPLASPFGWHDTDGQVGPEYTITRGNNVHAYLDVENANFSQGDEPDGGAELLFDFYFDINDEPQHMRDASVTQMFYLNNMMHDFSYRYGFDEAAGNFQQLNYSGEGIGNDYVLAEAQDGSQYNNANFGTPPDGSPGRMQMFLWNPPGGQLLTIESPNTISGPYNTGFATYGPAVNATPITAPIIDVNDGSSIPTHGCLPLVNSDEVSGKIAMVDRGGCYFDEKTFIAQQAGAVAVIICNHQEGFLLINPSPVNLPPINIPTISLGASDCATIRLQLAAGEEVIGSIVQPNEGGPSAVSGDFDNGIMSHEYAHGISARLTGGPSNVDCLFNDEQMGEGWSDFFALATTTPPGLDGATPRGIGNYTARKLPDAGGVRRLPYTTDWAINSQTYDDIIGTTSYQQLGEVWAGTLWDIYWAFVDTYDFDEDFIHGDGGNNMAIQLVTDAMKLQACSPGFIDGRDAILMADSLAYDGIHQCLLWEVFARRGLGYYAQQNSRYNRNDGFEDFTVKPSCITELKIAKSVDQPLILPGDDVTVYLTVTNDKLEDATNVVVTDQLPDGLTYLPGSAQGADVAVMGNTLTFGLGDLIPGEVHTFQYQVSSDPLRFSAQQFFDGMEDGDGNWTFANLQGINIWDLTTNNPYEGVFAWYVPNADTQNDQVLELIEPFTVNGDHPVFRFYHRYQTSPGEAGGLVQISTDGGATWSFVPEQFIRNGYRGRLSYFTFTIPGLDAFWGDSNSYLDSYIDLTPYLGQTINLRFRFGSDDQVGLFGGGWYVDNVEIMDLYSYQWETCATSSEGDTPCAILPEGGIFVESGMFSPAEDLTLDPARIKVYPNPTRDRLNLRFTGQWSGQAQLQLHTLHGVRVRTWQQALSENALLELDVDGVPPGLYLLEIRTPEGQHVSKVTVQ